MSTVKTLFWDVYGTLIAAQRGDLDSLIVRAPELRAAFTETVATFSLQVEPAKLHDLFLRCIQAAWQERAVAHPEIRIDEIWFKLLEKFRPEPTPTLSAAQEVALFFERRANPKHLMPGAFDTLVALQQRGYRQGLISNAQFYTPIELSELLRQESDCRICTYESIFDPALVVFSHQLGVSKPAPALFHHVLGTLNPADCVMIGDSLKNDIEPARALGLQTIHFGTDIHDLRELLTRL